MGEVAQKRVMARHSVAVQADRLISLFRQTVGRPVMNRMQ
jgi:hypothetical protein